VICEITGLQSPGTIIVPLSRQEFEMCPCFVPFRSHGVPSSPGKRAEVAAKVMGVVTDGMGFRGMHQSEV